MDLANTVENDEDGNNVAEYDPVDERSEESVLNSNSDQVVYLAILLGMSLVTELAALRVLTVLLLIVLVGLSFYILFDALERCKEVESRLTQEISDMTMLTEEDSEDED